MPRNYANPNRMIPEVNQTLPTANTPLIAQNVGAPNPATMPPLAQMAVQNTQANNIMNGTTNSVNRMQGPRRRRQNRGLRGIANQVNGRRQPPVRARAFNAMNRMRGNAMRGYS